MPRRAAGGRWPWSACCGGSGRGTSRPPATRPAPGSARRGPGAGRARRAPGAATGGAAGVRASAREGSRRLRGGGWASCEDLVGGALVRLNRLDRGLEARGVPQLDLVQGAHHQRGTRDADFVLHPLGNQDAPLLVGRYFQGGRCHPQRPLPVGGRAAHGHAQLLLDLDPAVLGIEGQGIGKDVHQNEGLLAALPPELRGEAEPALLVDLVQVAPEIPLHAAPLRVASPRSPTITHFSPPTRKLMPHFKASRRRYAECFRAADGGAAVPPSSAVFLVGGRGGGAKWGCGSVPGAVAPALSRPWRRSVVA